MNKHYCKECDENVDLEIKTELLKGELKGEELTYEGKVSYGSECKHEIIDEEILSINEKVLNDTYRKHNNILSLAEIRNLPKVYGIGKRPLSLILGWGELTFTRYFEGDIPSNTYANILLEISSPELYLKTLELRKNLISENTYKKSKKKTMELMKNSVNSSSIFSYILSECVDITEKSICKLVYYIDGFHMAFFGNWVVNEETMVKGIEPFYQNVVLETLKFVENHNLTVTEKLIADNVIKYLGCYSGKVLSNFVESEPPLISASINHEKIVDKSQMKAYFESVIKKYEMISPLDIHVFAEEKFKLK